MPVSKQFCADINKCYGGNEGKIRTINSYTSRLQTELVQSLLDIDEILSLLRVYGRLRHCRDP